MASPLENALGLLQDIGFFSVVLPFLLIFTIVFALLEKTKILGVEKDKETPKRNLNALVAFCIALFVVVTQRVVAAITTSLPQVAFLLVVIISFLLVVGSFFKTGEFSYFSETNGWKIFISIVLLIGILLIFMGAIDTENGESVLKVAWEYALNNLGTGSTVVWTVIVLGATIAGITVVLRGSKSGG